MAKANVKKKLQFWGTGRRKKAIARVRLIPGGNGTIVINDRTFEDYFPQGTRQYIVKQPLVAVDVEGKYDVFVNVVGGGYTGQAGAIRLGVARALLEAEENSRPTLKAAGFLTRDPRAKERKKYGLKKARRAPQFSKR
ncbi:MAG: 30S ribosomal protein S9 [Clostridia bacterium]|nr:30S ribosomal protein S9 [Clostridia bacterium]